MQVILLEKINHLGELGAVVKVKDGYARNFLIPQGHAKRATKAAIAEFEARRAELEKAQAERIAAAEELAGKINGQTVTIASKAGVDGRLFGSVTNADIAEALDKLGFQIKKSQVRTPLGAIKSLGDYTITIGLMTDITADVTVQVVAEENLGAALRRLLVSTGRRLAKNRFEVRKGFLNFGSVFSYPYPLDVIIERPGSLRRYKVRVLFEFAAKVSAAGPQKVRPARNRIPTCCG